MTVWYISPNVALWTFLLISAYHFGESQLVPLIKAKKYNHIIFFLWGTWLIVSLLFFNSIELEEIANQSTAFSINKKTLSILPPLFYLLSISLFVVLVSLSVSKILKVNHLFQEIFTLILLALTFHIFPFIVGFTMYFVFLHSNKSLVSRIRLFKIKNQEIILHFIYKVIITKYNYVFVWSSHFSVSLFI